MLVNSMSEAEWCFKQSYDWHILGVFGEKHLQRKHFN